MEFLPTQKKLIHIPHNEQTDIAYYQGGLGSGKTQVGVAIGMMISDLYPGSRGLVAAYEYTLLSDTTREKYFEMLDDRHVKKWVKGGGNDRLILNNGSEIWFRSAKNFGRLQSTEFNWIHIDEIAQFVDKKPYDHLIGRLRRKPTKHRINGSDLRHRLILTGNPEEDAGWLYNEFISPKKKYVNRRYMIAPTTENHFLLKQKPDYVEELKKNFSKEDAEIYIYGKTGTIRKGKVYHEFNESRNISDSLIYVPNNDLMISFDFNAGFMYASIYQKINDKLNCIDEVAIRDSVTEEVVNEIINRYDFHNGYVHVYGDPSGYHRDHRSRINDYREIMNAFSNVSNWTTINHVYKNDATRPEFRIRNRSIAVNALLCNAKNEVRLYISDKCEYMINSLRMTKWDSKKSDQFVKNKVNDSNSDEFVIDHPGDTLDYIVAKEFKYLRPNIDFA